MSVIKNGICDLCQRKVKWAASNSFHGHYCIQCIKLNRAEDAECLREIKKAIEEEKIKS